MNIYNSGFSLISFMLLLALLSFLVSASYYQAKSLVKLNSDFIHTSKAKNKANSQILSKLADLTPSNSLIQCLREDTEIGKAKINRELCVQQRASTINFSESASTQLDYNLIFSQPSQCELYKSAYSNVSSYGLRLTSSTSQSAWSCSQIPDRNLAQFVVKANYENNQDIVLAETGKPYLFASLGYLDIASSVEIAGETIFLAGGDLRIEWLRYSGAEPVRLTLISATGSVILKGIEGNIRLWVRAREQSYIPSGVEIEEHGLMPGVLDGEVLWLGGGGGGARN